MENQNYKLTGRNETPDELDAALDAALTHYAAVEPRAGLEERILAHLHASDAMPSHFRAWWKWGVTLAAVAIIVAALALRWERTSKPVIANDPQIAPEAPAETKLPPLHATVASISHKRSPVRRNNLTPVVETEAVPKLNVFPSPAPLTEQEKMALNYVREFPEEAGLVARAQTNLARREEMERMQPAAAASPSTENQE